LRRLLVFLRSSRFYPKGKEYIGAPWTAEGVGLEVSLAAKRNVFGLNGNINIAD
jgi:hypothetical protein